MLTKEQANALADSLIAEGRSARRSRTEVRARRVPSSYRSQALPAVPANRQTSALAEARRTALRTRQAMGLISCWVAVLVLLVVLLWSAHRGAVLWLALMVVMLMGLQIRALLVRLRFQELLLDARDVAS